MHDPSLARWLNYLTKLTITSATTRAKNDISKTLAHIVKFTLPHHFMKPSKPGVTKKSLNLCCLRLYLCCLLETDSCQPQGIITDRKWENGLWNMGPPNTHRSAKGNHPSEQRPGKALALVSLVPGWWVPVKGKDCSCSSHHTTWPCT